MSVNATANQRDHPVDNSDEGDISNDGSNQAWREDCDPCHSVKRRRIEYENPKEVENSLKCSTEKQLQDASEKAKHENESIESLTLNDFCDELLQKIFTYLPAQYVFGVISKVCSRWESIAKDPTTLNKTQLYLDERDYDLCVELCREAPCVGEVIITPSHNPSAFNVLIQGPTMKKLVIVGDSDWHRFWPSATDLIALLQHNKLTLQQLSMPLDSKLVQNHRTAGGPSFQAIIAGMKKLTHLHLIGECWRNWDEWNWSSDHPKLHTLKIDGGSFVSYECRFIRDLIMICKPTLKILQLPCQLASDALSMINDGVFEGSLVEELFVDTSCLRVLSQMHHLKVLVITDKGIQDCNLTWLKENPFFSRVWKLTLQGVVENPEEGQQSLMWHLLSKFNSVADFEAIESLINENTFSMFLRNNLSLKEMHFFNFSGFDNPNQVELLNNLPNLIVLDFALSDTEVSDEMRIALQNFKKQRPSLKLILSDDVEEEPIEIDIF